MNGDGHISHDEFAERLHYLKTSDTHTLTFYSRQYSQQASDDSRNLMEMLVEIQQQFDTSLRQISDALASLADSKNGLEKIKPRSEMLCATSANQTLDGELPQVGRQRQCFSSVTVPGFSASDRVGNRTPDSKLPQGKKAHLHIHRGSKDPSPKLNPSRKHLMVGQGRDRPPETHQPH